MKRDALVTAVGIAHCVPALRMKYPFKKLMTPTSTNVRKNSADGLFAMDPTVATSLSRKYTYIVYLSMF